MNDKISLRRLAADLPGFDGIDEDQKVGITKEIFAEIANILAEGEEIKITGLGTFAVTSAPGGEKEVTFTPAPEAEAIVNAPFAAFMPDELCDAVSDQMLDEINHLDTPDPEEIISQTVAIEETPAVVEPIEETPVIMESVEEIPVMEPTIEEEYVPEPQPVVVPGEMKETPVSSITMPPSADTVTPVVDVEPHPVVVPAIDTVEEIVVEIPEPQPQPEPQPEPQPAPETEQEPQPAPEPEPVKESPRTAAEPDDRYYRRHRSHQHTSHEPRKSRFGLGFLCGILSGLAIGGMAFLAYILYQINTAPAPDYDDYDEEVYTSELIDEL